MKRTLPLLVCALCVLAVAFVSGCTGGSQPIVVTLTPSGAQSVVAGQTVAITAAVSNDKQSKGVTWSLTGPGALSGQTTTSVTYTAPSPIAANATVTITATSVTDTTKSITLTINLQAVSIALTPSTTQTDEQGETTNVTAAISNDPMTKGVTWSLTGAGVLSGQTATAVTYTAPASITTASTATITAISVFDNTKTATLTINLVPPPSVTTTSLPAGTVGASYSATLAATNGVTPYAWSITLGALPGGLTLTANTGAISGTPTAFGTFNFTVQAKDAHNFTATAALSIKINPAPVSITTTSLPNGVVNASYSATLQSTGGAPPITWSVTAGSLPTGLTLAANGAITGTPTTAGTSNFTVQAADSSTPALTATKALSITIIPVLSITTSSLPNGITSTAYSATLASTGGSGAVTWTVTVGSLPAGLTLNISTGAISGTPTTAGTSNFTVQAADSGAPQQKVTKALSITIVQQLVITNTSLPTGAVNSVYSATLQSSGGTPAVTWAITLGTLPPGLTLNAATGAISGTPTTATGSPFNFTVQATDSGTPQQTATKALMIVINPVLAITTTSLASGTVGTAYSQTLQTNGGGIAPISWSITLGSLPPGLNLNASTGVISGTPTTATGSPFNFTVQAADSGTPQQTASKALSISIAAAPLSVATASLPDGVVSQSYSATLQSAGGNPPVTWIISVGSLPAGLTLNASTGAITGTPTTAGTTTFTVKATDSTTPTVQTATKQLSIRVNTVLTITTTSLPNGTINTSYSATLQSSGGATPITWSITVGTLPAGLTLNASTGVISGTPTSAGTSNFTVKATDSTAPAAQTATQALSITVNTAPLVISTTTLPNGAVGTVYNQTLQATGGTPPITWNITVGTLPAGLLLNGSTGSITGTPTTAGTSNFTVKATDSTTPTAQTVSQALSITVSSSGTLTCPLPLGGSESLLNGTYAILFNGWNDTKGMFQAAASVIANGTGTITGGVADSNGVGQTPATNQTITGGCYTIATGGRGKMIWNFSGGSSVTFSIVMRADGKNGDLIEFDDSTGTSGTRGSGSIRLQDTTLFVVSTLSGPWAFGDRGVKGDGTRAGSLGAFTLGGASLTLTAGAVDYSEPNVSFTGLAATGSFTAPDATHGRGTLTITIQVPAPIGALTLHFAYYITRGAGGTQPIVFIQSTDTPDSVGHALLNGIMTKQIGQIAGSYSNASLNGTVIFALTGDDTSHPGLTNTVVGLATSPGNGTFTAVLDQEADAMPLVNQAGSGTISIGANGLGTVQVTSPAGLVPTSIVMVAPNTALMLEGNATMAGHDAQTGILQPQSAGPFTTSSLSGTLIFGSDEPAQTATNVDVGTIAITSPGVFTITQDSSSTGGLQSNQVMTGTYTMAANGRGDITITGGGSGTAVIYLLGPNKAVVMPRGGGAIALFNLEQ